MPELRYRKPEEIARDNYFVSYRFANIDSPLATLSLTYTRQCPDAEVVSDMEREFQFWFDKYPLPLMLSAFNQAGDLIHLLGKENFPHLLGFPDSDKKCFCAWKLFPDKMIPGVSKSYEYQEKIYEEIPYESAEILKARVNKEYRQRAISVKLLFCYLRIFIFLIIPLAWLIGGLFYSIIALLSTIWAFCIFGLRIAKETGWIKESAAAKQRREKKAKMEHYFYHCEKNPDGFERLKHNNFESEEKESIQRKFHELKKHYS